MTHRDRRTVTILAAVCLKEVISKCDGMTDGNEHYDILQLQIAPVH